MRFLLGPRTAVATLCLALGLAVASPSFARVRIQRRARPWAHGIAVNVPTGGCTRRSDFVIRSISKNKEAIVIIHRRIRDLCKGYFPHGTWIAFSWHELGLAPGTRVVVFEENP